MELDQRQLLREMFPNLNFKVIDHALKTHQEDPHQAIDWLLMRVFAPLPPRPVIHQEASAINIINVEQQQNAVRFREEVLRWHHLIKNEIKRRSKKAKNNVRNKNLPQVPSRGHPQESLISQRPQQFYLSTNLNEPLYAGRTGSQIPTLSIHRSVSSSPDFQSMRNSFISLMGEDHPPPSYHERHRDPMVRFMS